MFNKEILNMKQLCEKLNISSFLFYKMVQNGLPYHQLGKHARKYYIYNEVETWLINNGFKKRTVWK